MFRGRVTITAMLALLILMAGFDSCGYRSSDKGAADSAAVYTVPTDTLRVGTLYSPTSYFMYRDQEMGYDYSLVSQLCSDKGWVLQLTVAPNQGTLLEMLDSGLIDLAAYEIPIITEYRNRALPCGPRNSTWQVLVQPRNDTAMITDVTQLVDRDIYVEAGSKYAARLANLNDELGGGVRLHPIARDTLIAEDLIAMVSDGDIPLTVVDSDIARLNKTYYNNLDITLRISFPQKSAWAVAPAHQALADTIDAWFNQDNHRRTQAELLKRYFELSKVSDPSFSIDLSRGIISPYDAHFKHYATEIAYDWRLLAAQGFAESRFDTTLVSWAGARGIMQIMPGTARSYGLSADKITNPEANIRTAAKIVADLDKSLKKFVPDPTERRKFVVAAYNSGIAHIYDAIALAQKYGKNPQVWNDNVEEALMMKSNPDYYNDPVCRYGYFRGRQTQEYVRKVMDFYQKCQKHIPK